MRNKKASTEQIGIDINPSVIQKWEKSEDSLCKLINDDAISALQKLKLDSETVIYADPPYHPLTRRRRKVYKHDYSLNDHIMLLDFVLSIPSKVIISGYYSDLYSDKLKYWNVHKFKAKTHTDVREEYIWYNFEKPKKLHDYKYVGNNFRERERIRRKRERIIKNLMSMPIVEVNAILSTLKENVDPIIEN